MRKALRIIAIACWPWLTAGAARAADAPGVEFFESRIRPIFVENCNSCHSAGAKKLKGDLRVDSRASLLKGGTSGTAAVVPGKVDGSNLIHAVKWEDEDLRMPPKTKLAPEKIADLEAWVKMGAPMPADAPATTTPASAGGHPVAMTLPEGRKFWSFVPPREPAVPAIDGALPIDAFLRAKLADKKLAFSPPADKRTLIRRATYDLIGLPPSATEIEAFVADASPDAFAKVIDRLLASPQYGERWARHWLDVARYADTKGYVFEEERRYAFSYTYRDWVIRALNSDLPYDQFLIQQIAADKMDRKGDNKPLAALGFLTLGRRFLNNQTDIIDDRIDVVCRGTMALTVACARCHDHKYDPIPTADYYSLYGVFQNTIEPAELPLIGGENPKQLAEFEAELKKRIAEREEFTEKRFNELLWSSRWPAEIAKYLLAAQRTVEPPHPINEEFEIPDDAKGLNPWMTRRWEAYLKSAAAKNDGVFEAWRRYVAGSKDGIAALTKELARTPSINPIIARFVLAGEPPKSIAEVAARYGTAISKLDSTTPYADPQLEAVRLVIRAPDAPTNVLIADAEHLFGNVDRMKRRGLKSAIDNLIATHPGSPERAMAVEDVAQPTPAHVFKRGNPGNVGPEVPRQLPAILAGDDRKPFTDGSGRLELAKAIASKSNPLTARVIVNRIWQYHFGAALVRTPGDFGTRGSPPTNPELLDYLALRFMNEDGWSLKKLHRRMMLTQAYQQASIDRPEAREIDPENKLVWRQSSQRLDFESMRDSLLAASGTLDLTTGGRPIDIFAQPFTGRRSIYAFIDRQNLPGMFRTFDFASPDATSVQRFSTTVPQQALFMMNSPFAIEQAKKLAARKDVSDQAEPAARVAALYRAVLGRAPTPAETELAAKFVASEESQSAKPQLARATQWSYGYGEFDEAAGRVVAFAKYPHFNGTTWNGGEKMPDPALGWSMLMADGGHAGNDQKHATIRRFTAPRDCTLAVEGKLTHNKNEGDGVRARIVSSREGALATWQLHNQSAETQLAGVQLKQGETLDFIIDCGRKNDVNFDDFKWKVTLLKQPSPDNVAGDDNGSTWDSVEDFSGPTPAPPKPLNAWEKLAQVLLESNEFAFVD